MSSDVIIPDPACTPTLSVTEAAKLLGVHRTTYYAAANRAEVPCLKVGGTMRVPTAPLLELLGLTVPQTASAQPSDQEESEGPAFHGISQTSTTHTDSDRQGAEGA